MLESVLADAAIPDKHPESVLKRNLPNAPCILSLLIVFVCARADAANCPAVPPAPVPTSDDLAFHGSWQGVAEPYTARYATGGDGEPSYGVGYLHVSGESEAYYDWPRHIVLPLWETPEEKSFHGWIHSGRIHFGKSALPSALSGIGMVETDYEHTSFIVHERLDDGWLRIKLRRGNDGDAWTHECHLEIGREHLVYEGWEAFLREHGQWLHFRDQVPHMLRKEPHADGPLRARIGLDHKLVLLDIKGDWMRVIVEQPDLTCVGETASELEQTVHEGWIKWRDDEMGPWTWVYTRGC